MVLHEQPASPADLVHELALDWLREPRGRGLFWWGLFFGERHTRVHLCIYSSRKCYMLPMYITKQVLSQTRQGDFLPGLHWPQPSLHAINRRTAQETLSSLHGVFLTDPQPRF